MDGMYYIKKLKEKFFARKQCGAYVSGRQCSRSDIVFRPYCWQHYPKTKTLLLTGILSLLWRGIRGIFFAIILFLSSFPHLSFLDHVNPVFVAMHPKILNGSIIRTQIKAIRLEAFDKGSGLSERKSVIELCKNYDGNCSSQSISKRKEDTGMAVSFGDYLQPGSYFLRYLIKDENGNAAMSSPTELKFAVGGNDFFTNLKVLPFPNPEIEVKEFDELIRSFKDTHFDLYLITVKNLCERGLINDIRITIRTEFQIYDARLFESSGTELPHVELQNHSDLAVYPKSAKIYSPQCELNIKSISENGYAVFALLSPHSAVRPSPAYVDLYGYLTVDAYDIKDRQEISYRLINGAAHPVDIVVIKSTFMDQPIILNVLDAQKVSMNRSIQKLH